MPAIINMNNITTPQRGQGVNIKLIIIMVSVFRKDTHFQTILLIKKNKSLISTWFFIKIATMTKQKMNI